MIKRILSVLISLALLVPAIAAAQTKGNPRVKITTNYGTIVAEFDEDAAPVTIKNFLKYVDSGHYNGTIFHRVVKGFVIQGGGFKRGFFGLSEKSTGKPIRNEADNGLKNRTGTIAMARKSDPHSATAQFFINTNHNLSLDHKSKDWRSWGYAVFGKVVEGMDVVRKIEAVPTRIDGNFKNLPVKNVEIEKIEAQ